jgi:hypothetical protein
VLLVGVALGAPGCVYVYQPLVGLQQPVVVSPDAQNLVGVALTVRCFPGELLSVQEAGSLCSKVGALFEQQGAQVSLTLGAQAPAEPLPADAPTQLTVELRARELSASSDPLRWTACYFSYSLIPAVTEASFAQDVDRARRRRLLARGGVPAGPHRALRRPRRLGREHHDELPRA